MLIVIEYCWYKVLKGEWLLVVPSPTLLAFLISRDIQTNAIAHIIKNIKQITEANIVDDYGFARVQSLYRHTFLDEPIFDGLQQSHMQLPQFIMVSPGRWNTTLYSFMIIVNGMATRSIRHVICQKCLLPITTYYAMLITLQ